jgi:hypothetical protein
MACAWPPSSIRRRQQAIEEDRHDRDADRTAKNEKAVAFKALGELLPQRLMGWRRRNPGWAEMWMFDKVHNEFLR